jgi:hypothetical protein
MDFSSSDLRLIRSFSINVGTAGKKTFVRHPDGSRDPGWLCCRPVSWIPAFAGMTKVAQFRPGLLRSYVNSSVRVKDTSLHLSNGVLRSKKQFTQSFKVSSGYLRGAAVAAGIPRLVA